MKKYDLSFRLKSSLVHTEESISNISNIFREKRFVNDEIFEIPSLHGNSIRGRFRDIGAEHLCDFVNIQKNTMDQDVFHFLFSGGHLEKIENGISIDEKRKIRELFPFLSIFGAAMGKDMLRGKLIVSSAIPRCSELGNGINSFYDMTSIVRYTREDDSKKFSGEKHIKNKKNKDKKTQMFYDIEVLNPGIILDCFVIIDTDDAIEHQVFDNILIEFMKKPFFGGSSRIGHGEVELINVKKSELNNKKYLDHLTKSKKEIIKYLQENKLS